LIGSTVGPYQLIDRLGAGGMGEVYLGHDPRLQRRVALKCLAATHRTDDEQSRVLREARAAARLNHPNIAAVYDVLEQADRTFIVMELVEGESLAARMTRDRIPLDQVRQIGRQLASALAAAHAQGVIHRDLKPANIHVTSDGAIKILDFGVAKFATAHTGDATDLHPDPTLGGNPGTPNYMAPEQLFGRGVDARSDIYSLGVILYQMVTGRRPYDASGAIQLAVAMSKDAPRPPSAFNPDVPPDLEETIMTALEREPENRFQTAREVDIALRMPGERSGSRSTVRASVFAANFRRRQMRKRAIDAAAIVIVMTLGAVAWRFVPKGRPSTAAPAASAPAARRAIAVIPLENLSGDRAKDYLGAGVAETLTMALSKVPTLTVLSRGEIADATKRDRDIKRLTHDLGLSYAVDGSIQAAGDRYRITLRLVRPDGTVAWSEAYEDTQSVMFVLHRAMASDLVAQLEGAAASHVDLTVPSTTNVDALDAYWRGRSLFDHAVTDRDFRDALGAFRRAVLLDPKFALGYAGIADTLWQQYRVTRDSVLPLQALDAGLTALKLDAAQPAVRVAVATVYEGMGQYDEAVGQLRRALDVQPSSDDAHRVLSRVFLAQGKVDEAIAELRTAISYRPKQWSNYDELGRLFYRMRRYPEAVEAYQQALQISPNDARTYLSLGGAYLGMRDYRRTLEMSSRSNEIAATGLAYSNMGTAHYALGHFDEAAKNYEAAIKLNPKSPLVHGNLGDAYRRLGRAADARREYAAARDLAVAQLQVNTKDAPAMARAAMYEAKLGLKSEAAMRAADAAALAPTNPDVQYKRAVVAAVSGDAAVALQALQRALALGVDPRDVRDDYDFESLRGSNEFLNLLSRHP